MSTLDDAIERAQPASLQEITEGAALMTRTDQKYFVPRELLGELLSRFRGMKVLQIDGQRYHPYRSLYFDTGNLLFFRQHVQGRRVRNKVRIRTYGSGDSFLEVKAKGNRGQTVKDRIPLVGAPKATSGMLPPEAYDFIEQHVQGPGVTRNLRPVLESRYERVTLLQGVNRITCDINLEFRPGIAEGGTGSQVHRGPDDVLVETKTPAGRSPIDHHLRTLGIRPVSVSKYGVGLSLIHPDVPANRWHRVLRRHFYYSPDRTRLNVHSLLRRKEAGITTPMVMSCAQ